jgi:hypothetical protein
MSEDIRGAPATPVSDARRNTMRWTGIVIMISGVAVLISAAVQSEWLTAAYFTLAITYGALLRWRWPFVTRNSRIAASVVVITSLLLAATTIWREFS